MKPSLTFQAILSFVEQYIQPAQIPLSDQKHHYKNDLLALASSTKLNTNLSQRIPGVLTIRYYLYALLLFFPSSLFLGHQSLQAPHSHCFNIITHERIDLLQMQHNYHHSCLIRTLFVSLYFSRNDGIFTSVLNTSRTTPHRPPFSSGNLSIYWVNGSPITNFA